MKKFAILTVLLLAACSRDESIRPTVNVAAPHEESGIKLGPVPDYETVPSDAQITSLTYNKGDHSLTINIKYSGCEEVLHSIELGNACAASYPMQCGATLVRATDFDGSCEKIIEQSFHYPLDDGFDTAHLSVSNSKSQRLSVTVDRNGVLSPP